MQNHALGADALVVQPEQTELVRPPDLGCNTSKAVKQIELYPALTTTGLVENSDRTRIDHLCGDRAATHVVGNVSLRNGLSRQLEVDDLRM